MGLWIARFRDGPLENYARRFAVGPIFEDMVFAPVRRGVRGGDDKAWALVSWDALPVEHHTNILVRYVLDVVHPGGTEDAPPVAYYVSVGSLNGANAHA